jgi:hypothetical protein
MRTHKNPLINARLVQLKKASLYDVLHFDFDSGRSVAVVGRTNSIKNRTRLVWNLRKGIAYIGNSPNTPPKKIYRATNLDEVLDTLDHLKS